MVPSGEGFVLVFKNFDKFNARDKDTAYHVLDIIQNNSWKLLVGNQKKLIAFCILVTLSYIFNLWEHYLYFGTTKNGLIRAEGFSQESNVYDVETWSRKGDH
ncbi:hypothetical protein ABN764_20245 [Paenibacillaceae sp. P-4]|uniref:hypothetical protein n=1 Tax=Paenibacillaceae bacterium P-4 TaxID=3160969 RepID=UPI0032E81BB3